MAPEILNQLDGKITHFVSSDRTGAVLEGTGRFMKELVPDVKIVLARTMKSVEKEAAAFRTLCSNKLKKIRSSVIDAQVEVSELEKVMTCRRLAKVKGLLCGKKSGTNVCAAVKVCKQQAEQCLQLNPGSQPKALVCTVLPDVGLKFLSTVFNDDWYKSLCDQMGSPAELKELATQSLLQETKLCNAAVASELMRTVEAFDISELIGGTPMIDLSHLVKNTYGTSNVRLFAKIEFFNPGFSIKDRIIRNIFNKAEREGLLKPGMTVVAASSGNTGAATAMFAAARNYRCVITTSPKCSQEKMDSIKAYGAELVVSSPGIAEGHPKHYMNLARTLAEENPDWFDVDQYYNLDNPEGHYLTLGPEIYEQTNGEVTKFVCAASTGGTISGTAKFLKETDSQIQCILGDPTGSIFHGYYKTGVCGKPGKFLVEGVGKGSIPGCMNLGLVDAVVTIDDSEAFQMCDILARKNGILAGGSSGLNVCAALKVANESKLENDIVVTILPDSGIKYQSKIYNPNWLRENNVAFRKT